MGARCLEVLVEAQPDRESWARTLPMPIRRRQITIRLSQVQWEHVWKMQRAKELKTGQPVSYQEIISDMLDRSMEKKYVVR
jgi:hypothetical protein